jgi:hypothetical protein
MNEPNNLECYITKGWKSLPRTNTVAYCDHFKIVNNKRRMNTTFESVFKSLHFNCNLQNGGNRLECYIKIGLNGLPGTSTLDHFIS